MTVVIGRKKKAIKMSEGYKHYLRKYARSVERRILPQKPRNPRSTPICLFCYHKGGTSLLGKVFREISHVNEWRIKGLVGMQTEIPDCCDVLLYMHSLVDFPKEIKPFLGVHVIRDPRDIIVSGYLYHRRTREKWCINDNFSHEVPVLSPRVPYAEEHRPESWKINYLKSLGNKSYQDNLLSMSQRDGLLFEIENFGSWTIENMKKWSYKQNNILEIKFETIMNDYDASFYKIFKYLEFSDLQIESALEIAEKHDLSRKSEMEIKKIEHVSSGKSSKWKGYFEQEHKELFLKKFGAVLIDLGYESSNDW